MPFSDSEAGGGLRAATETVQTMFEDFQEPVIAGNTPSEISAMSRNQRHRWYRSISSQDKAEAMRVVECERKQKISEGNHGRKHTEETRQKISEALRGRKRKPFSEEHKRKLSEAGKGKIVSEETRTKISATLTGKLTGEKHYSYGKPLSEEHKAKISASNSGKNNPMFGRVGEKNPFYGETHTENSRRKISEANRGERNHNFGKTFSDEHLRKISEALRGQNNPSWRGGSSYLPYCPAFNEPLKEKIRNRDNRVCVLCGRGEIQNGQRLSVHHINSDKMQGCNGVPWYLCALCRSCNSRPDTVEKEFLIVTGGHGG